MDQGRVHDGLSRGTSHSKKIYLQRKNIDSREFYDGNGCICFLSWKQRENKDVDQEIELESPFLFSVAG